MKRISKISVVSDPVNMKYIKDRALDLVEKWNILFPPDTADTVNEKQQDKDYRNDERPNSELKVRNHDHGHVDVVRPEVTEVGEPRPRVAVRELPPRSSLG
jgi:hypothetical protein